MLLNCVLTVSLVWAAACSDDGKGKGADGGTDTDSDTDSDVDTDSDSDTDSDTTPFFGIVSPDDGYEVLGSVNVVVHVNAMEIDAVRFFLDGAEDPYCVDTGVTYMCFVDLSDLEVGSMHEVEAVGLLDDAEVASDSITVERVPMYSEICLTDELQDEVLVTCLQQLLDDGLVAGNIGDSYDNRDGDHTNLNTSNHPDVIYLHTGYGTEGFGSAPENQNPYAPVVGNASLCANADAGWCEGMVRVKLRYGYAPTFHDLYTGSNFYWFPEHHDHDEEDLAFYMVPFTNSSQGSSGSEMDEVGKWLYSLAAMTSDAKDEMKGSGTLMPAIQMAFRRTRVATDSEYMTGEPHLNAYDNLDNGHQMVRLVNLIRADNVPPLCQLSVVEESWSMPEREITTADSIARHWEGDTDTPRTITVSAENSYDPNDRSLSYHWRVIRGDPEEVTITPLNDVESEVEIEFLWHEAETLMLGDAERISTLAIVAAFVHNDVYFSAPAFVTSSTSDDL
jgi:hypothetical protein